MILRSPSLKVGLFLFLIPALWSCGGSSDKKTDDSTPCASANAVTAEATFDSLWTNVFSSRCGSCHGVSTNSDTLGGPDLRTKDAFHASLVGLTLANYDNWETAQQTLGGTCTAKFIAAGSAKDSLVVAILDESVSISGCKVKNHLIDPQSICISSGSLANLKKWIDNGASK